jgi:preprotein translocase subunit YajC
MFAFLPLILLFAVFYFLLISPQQKRAKQHKTFMEDLKKGATIITLGGLCEKIMHRDLEKKSFALQAVLPLLLITP